MKVMCMYLPQYHRIKENDEWWEPGYTEWSAVRRAKPLFAGHQQPKVPLDNRYYDLDKEAAETFSWQAGLAKEYGIYGFCIYHYWFLGQQLLERPAEKLLAHPEIDLKYSLCWANETWTKTWYDLADHILMKQEYGVEADWKRHFYYLLPFFLDKRYIKIDNKPMLHIYRTPDIRRLPQMLACFQKLARENGFDGIYLVSAMGAGELEQRTELIDAFYQFEPGYTLKHDLGGAAKCAYNASVLAKTLRNKLLPAKVLERVIPAKSLMKRIVKRERAEHVFPGIFPQWDNTPRRSYKGLLYRGTSPELFGAGLKALRQQVQGREHDFVYINAFNEWGEGAYLEPDKRHHYRFLEAVRDAKG